MTAAQVRHLRSIAQHRLSVDPDVGPDRWRLRAGSYVGTIVIPGIRVLITPKVSTPNLFHLLEAGGRSLEVGAEQFEYGVSRDLLPAFATFYARHLERALGLGIPRAYVEQDERVAVVRGRIDLPAQRRRVGLPLPVHCRFDEYTADIHVNRIMRAAAMRLVRLAGVTRDTRQALASLAARLVDVGDVTTGDLQRPVVFTRLNEHCRPAERLARMVLGSSTLLDATGDAGAGVFMVDMNKVFEEFVEARLRRYLHGRLAVVGQHSSSLDIDRSVGIRPDLVFTDPSGSMVYVGDTKYKVTNDGRARESDYYQLLAYATALGLNEGVLVYCQNDGGAPAREVTVRRSGKRLRTWSIALEGTPAGLELEIRRLAEHIVERVHESSHVAVSIR